MQSHQRIPACAAGEGSHGITLVELMLAVMIVGLLSSLAVGSYGDALSKARVARAIADIKVIEKDFFTSEVDGVALPDSLDETRWGNLTDPWGRPYQYLNFANANRGQMRKDRFLVPINSTYDLYSLGKDGESRPPLQAAPSHDDIVRAGDGAFVGLASGF